MYQLLQSGDMQAIKIGTQYRIPYCFFLAYIENQAERQNNAVNEREGAM